MTQETRSACLGVFTEVQARPSVQDGLSTVLASKVTPTFVQHEERIVTIQWSQNLRSACTRVDEVPSRRQWMKQFLLQVRKHDKVCDRVFLELESDGTEELKMPECVRIADRHEHTAEVAPVRFLTCFQRCRERPCGC